MIQPILDCGPCENVCLLIKGFDRLGLMRVERRIISKREVLTPSETTQSLELYAVRNIRVKNVYYIETVPIILGFLRHSLDLDEIHQYSNPAY